MVFLSKGTSNMDIDQSFGLRYDLSGDTLRFTSSSCIHLNAVNP